MLSAHSRTEETVMEKATVTATATAIAKPVQPGLVSRFSGRFGVDPAKLLATLRGTCFRQRKEGLEVSNEQMMALLVVADQHGLNPFTKEILAFESKGDIIPVVSVDGWSRIINDHPELDGIEFRFSPDEITMPGAKTCPLWCEAVIYRKDRSRPTIVREYLDEVYVSPRNGYPGPWQSHTKRMLRHKSLIQGARVAFSFSGIYDEDEARRIIEAESSRVLTKPSNIGNLEDAVIGRSTPSPGEEPLDGQFEDVKESHELDSNHEGASQ
jgi:phage recombination protein Bet